MQNKELKLRVNGIGIIYNRFMNLVIIQARMASTRLPGKVLLELSPEKTVLDLLVERVVQAKTVDRIVIATTKSIKDLEILEHCKQKGYEVFIGSEDDCLDRHYQCARVMGADSISKIPSDVPFIDPKLIDKNISLFTKESFDFVSTLHPPTFPDGMDIETMTFNALRKAWGSAVKSYEREHTTPYIWDNPENFKIGAIESDQKYDYFMKYRFTIDYNDDLEFMKQVYKNFIVDDIFFTWQNLVKFLDNNPSIYSINRKYLGNNWFGKHIDELNTFDPLKTKEYK